MFPPDTPRLRLVASVPNRSLSAASSPPDGDVEESAEPTTRAVLDPRVAYLVTSLMEDVINHGTGFPVRQLGFAAPAAGKTGTSRDGWFAGYTSNLLCVVWVGFDDNRDLGLAGGAAAAPIWGGVHEARRGVCRCIATRITFDPPAGIIKRLSIRKAESSLRPRVRR